MGDSLFSVVNSVQPIERWLELVREPAGGSTAEWLREIYRDNLPTYGEIIFTGACEFECQHCIYPPDYVKFNWSLSSREWERILRDLNAELGIETFVYSGRSVTRSGVEALASLRAMLPEASIGLIDNGISMIPHRAQLSELRLAWIDVSLDGMEADHDRQRGRKGSFQAGLEGALWLKHHEIAPKVNILTCLTTINAGSVAQMITFLNDLGFKNFFIIPVSVLSNCRPSEQLVVGPHALARFIRELEGEVHKWRDAWVKVKIYDTKYMRFLETADPELLRGFHAEQDHLAWRLGDEDTYFGIDYYPPSLSGVREFIVNTNGDVILPKAMGKGKIPESDVLGSVLRERAIDIVKRLPDSSRFGFYLDQLSEEREAIGRMELGSAE